MTTATNTILNLTAGRDDRNRHGLRAPKGGCTVAGKLYKGGQFCLPYDPADPHGEAPRPVVLAIGGSAYEVEGIKAAPEIGTHAFALTRRGTGAGYFVILDNFGEARCDCPDFEFRRAGTGRPCKHGAALIAAGLMPSPRSPSPAPTPPAPARPARPRRFVRPPRTSARRPGCLPRRGPDRPARPGLKPARRRAPAGAKRRGAGGRWNARRPRWKSPEPGEEWRSIRWEK